MTGYMRLFPILMAFSLAVVGVLHGFTSGFDMNGLTTVALAFAITMMFMLEDQLRKLRDDLPEVER